MRNKFGMNRELAQAQVFVPSSSPGWPISMSTTSGYRQASHSYDQPALSIERMRGGWLFVCVVRPRKEAW